jgi:hypothetical protein
VRAFWEVSRIPLFFVWREKKERAPLEAFPPPHNFFSIPFRLFILFFRFFGVGFFFLLFSLGMALDTYLELNCYGYELLLGGQWERDHFRSHNTGERKERERFSMEKRKPLVCLANRL